MTSAKSCKTPMRKNPERTWLIEILRRCKALPVILAVAYFLANILPILLSYNTLESVLPYVYGAMTGASITNMVIGIAGGVVISCAVFRYLHSAAAVIDAHSRPQTRTQLFRGSFLAGLMMIAAPVVLTGLFYLCVLGAHTSFGMSEYVMSWGDWADPDKILCVSNVIGWVIDNILVIGLAYCISCFAAVLAGTAVIQALLSLLLLGLPSAIYLVFEGYLETFLYGYNGHRDISQYLSLYTHLFSRNALPFAEAPAILILHAVIAALAAFAAAAIYQKIKLENEERTIVVPLVADSLVVVLTMITASVSMFIIQGVMEEPGWVGAVVTLILATLVFFPIFCMISEQSFRILKKRNGNILIVYAAIMCMILAFTLFDVTGFEKRVPAASDVESINITDNNLIRPEVRNLTDQEMIAIVTSLHKSIVADETDEADKATFRGYKSAKSIPGVKVTYKLKNGKIMSRNYDSISEASFAEYEAYYNSKRIREQECFNEAKPLRHDEFAVITRVYPEYANEYEGEYGVRDKDIKGLAKAANKDIMNWTAKNRGMFVEIDTEEEGTDNSTYVVNVCLDARYADDENYDVERIAPYYVFTTDDKNLNKYVEEHNLLSEKNIITPDDPRYGGYGEDFTD